VKVICSYCRKDMGECGAPDPVHVSHGMCGECATYFERQWLGLDLASFLEDFALPVAAVDGYGRVIAGNGILQRVLSKAPAEIRGFLGGEVMECKYARLPEGCGNTVHCRDCAIRQTVQRTIAERRDQTDVPAYLDRAEGRMDMVISTRYVDGNVLLILESMAAAGA